MRRIPVFLLLAALAGCTDFPDLDGTIDPAVERQPFPKLQPQSRILGVARAADTDEAQVREALAQASEGLGARAEAARNARLADEATE